MKRTLVFLAFLAGTLSANAQILWKVSGNGLQKPSYILGTHHVASKDICDNIAGFNDAYAGIEQVYGEVDTEIMNDPATQFKLMPHMTMPKGQTLSAPSGYADGIADFSASLLAFAFARRREPTT